MKKDGVENDNGLGEKYNEQFEFCVKLTQDEYRLFSSDFARLQLTIVRTYMWVSSLLVAAGFTVVVNITSGHYSVLFPGVCSNFYWSYLFGLVYLLLSSVSFLLAIDILRGRCPRVSPIENTDSIISSLGARKNMQDRELLYRSFLSGYHRAIVLRKEQINFVGLRVRMIAKMIICSVLFGLVCVVGLGIESHFFRMNYYTVYYVDDCSNMVREVERYVGRLKR